MSSYVTTPDAIRSRLDAQQPKLTARGPKTKLSAVAAVIRFTDVEPEVMLIRRAEHPSDHWSGHMAFPGGRTEEADASTLHTAIRETREEVAVDLETHATLLGRLDDVQAVSKARAVDMLIAPYVFALTQPVAPIIDPSEVADLMWAELGPMVRGEVDCRRPYHHDGVDLDLPGYRVGEHIVWGLTYRMLELLFHAIRT